MLVLDPCTLKPLFPEIPIGYRSVDITWGSIPSAKNTKPTIIAWMPHLSLQVTFWHADGEWHTRSVRSCIGATKCLAAGGHFIFVDDSLIQAKNGISLCQYDFRSSESHVVAKSLEHAFSASAASPWPCGWSSMYVNVHVHIMTPASLSVVLVDSQKHRVVRTLSGRALGLTKAAGLSKEAFWDFCGVVWSRNGRHIAVRCRGVVFVLIF